MQLFDDIQKISNIMSLLKQHATTPLARSATLVHALCLSHLSRRRRTSSSFRHRRVRRSECVRWQLAFFPSAYDRLDIININTSSTNLIREDKILGCSKQAQLLREVNTIFLQRSLRPPSSASDVVEYFIDLNPSKLFAPAIAVTSKPYRL